MGLTMEKEEKKGKVKMKRGLRNNLLAVTLVPYVLFAIALFVFNYYQMGDAIHQEVETNLKNIAQNALFEYNKEFPGEYALDSRSGKVYKGNRIVSEAQELFENYKRISDCEITLFYKDVRLVTTIVDKYGKVIVGTKANSVVVTDVLDGAKECFYSKSKINGENYFSYYSPVKAESGEVVGMIFAGKKSAYVDEIIWKRIFPMMLTYLCAMAVVVAVVWIYSGQLHKRMQRLCSYIKGVEGGDFNQELSSNVTRKEDELAYIGKSAVQMKVSLSKLVERDSLTGLYNRHYGEVWMERVAEESSVTGMAYYVAIADIDFFKKFNDRYGHDCGDIVLREVSSILKKNMGKQGYASRWGGEEFLLIFYANDDNHANRRIEALSEEVRSMQLSYDGEKLQVTVTIGITKGEEGKTKDEIVKEADNALYEGKENGRNRVVWHKEEEKA